MMEHIRFLRIHHSTIDQDVVLPCIYLIMFSAAIESALAQRLQFLKRRTHVYQFPTLREPKPFAFPTSDGLSVTRYLPLAPQQKVMDTGRMPIEPEVAAVGHEARRLKDGGVDIVIALGNAGHRRNAEVARRVAEVDAVVAGPAERRSVGSDSFPQAVSEAAADELTPRGAVARG